MNTINAFELMKSASMLNYLPEFKLPARNSLDQLCIDGGGWIGKDNANNIGKRFVSDLTKSTTYAALCNKSSEYLINQRAITAENQNSLTHIVKSKIYRKYMEEN
ncbi:kinase-like domain-containing protein [Rhizophagus irregularis DAOM 181602=DAOM 197198]|nr:kinase-like domain-containing protein [Rhizophagus irregularis DAOM 181602=DAOM 197198]